MALPNGAGIELVGELAVDGVFESAPVLDERG